MSQSMFGVGTAAKSDAAVAEDCDVHRLSVQRGHSRSCHKACQMWRGTTEDFIRRLFSVSHMQDSTVQELVIAAELNILRWDETPQTAREGLTALLQPQISFGYILAEAPKGPPGLGPS